VQYGSEIVLIWHRAFSSMIDGLVGGGWLRFVGNHFARRTLSFAIVWRADIKKRSPVDVTWPRLQIANETLDRG